MRQLFAALAILFVCGLTPSLRADRVKVSGGEYQAINGGEYTITYVDASIKWDKSVGVAGSSLHDDSYMGMTGLAHDLSPASFQTFCIEYNETLVLGKTYVFEVADSATKGGLGGATGGFDTISEATGWLYRAFRTDTLPNYDDVGAARKTDARSLQLAFWLLENEITTANNEYKSNEQSKAWVDYALGLATANAGKDSGTRVLRTWEYFDPVTRKYGGYHQDLLTLVPLPASVWAGMILLSGYGIVRFRRTARA